MGISQHRRSAIEEGSWFVLYATNCPSSFRCDLVVKDSLNLRVILYSDGFRRLGKQGTDARKRRDGNWILRLTPWISLPVSSDQVEEFFRAHDRVMLLINDENP
jgi:hypothetical protein